MIKCQSPRSLVFGMSNLLINPPITFHISHTRFQVYKVCKWKEIQDTIPTSGWAYPWSENLLPESSSSSSISSSSNSLKSNDKATFYINDQRHIQLIGKHHICLYKCLINEQDTSHTDGDNVRLSISNSMIRLYNNVTLALLHNWSLNHYNQLLIDNQINSLHVVLESCDS